MERIKIWSQTKSIHAKNRMSSYEIIKHFGMRGLWSGGVTTTLRSSTGIMIRFYTFEKLFSLCENAFFSGGIDGILSIVANHPFDVVKTQIQQQNSVLLNKSTIKAFLSVYQQLGWQIFSKGLCYRLPRIFISQGITFMVFKYFNGI